MKKIKYILSALLLALCVMIPAFALVGCKKHYTVAISVVEGNGDVTRVDQLARRHSLIGSNDVEEGSRFEYAVVPATGYQIKYIKVDGRQIDFVISDIPEDDGFGIARPLLAEHVASNHTIKVAFEKRTYHLTFAFGGIKTNLLVDGDGNAIERTGEYEATFESIITNFNSGNFYWAGEPDEDEYGHILIGTNTIKEDMLLVSNLSEGDLKALLGVTD